MTPKPTEMKSDLTNAASYTLAEEGAPPGEESTQAFQGNWKEERTLQQERGRGQPKEEGKSYWPFSTPRATISERAGGQNAHTKTRDRNYATGVHENSSEPTVFVGKKKGRRFANPRPGLGNRIEDVASRPRNGGGRSR